MTPRMSSEQRRLQLADAAIKIVAERGLRRLTAAEVATEVGIADGTIFRHFASMEELALAALDRIEVLLDDSMPPEGDEPLARVLDMFRRRAELLDARPDVAKLVHSDDLFNAAGEAGQHRRARMRRLTLDFVRACAEEAAARGDLVEWLQPAELAVILFGTQMALMRLGAARAGAVERERVWATVERLVRR